MHILYYLLKFNHCINVLIVCDDFYIMCIHKILYTILRKCIECPIFYIVHTINTYPFK